MVDHDLVKYIHQYRKQGYEKEHIIAHVMKHGHSHEIAHEAAEHAERYIESGEEPPTSGVEAPKNPEATEHHEEHHAPPVEKHEEHHAPPINHEEHHAPPIEKHEEEHHAPPINHEEHHEPAPSHHKAPINHKEKKPVKKGPIILVAAAVIIVVILYFLQGTIGSEPVDIDDWASPEEPVVTPEEPVTTNDLSLTGPLNVVGLVDGLVTTCDETLVVSFDVQNDFADTVNASVLVSSNETNLVSDWMSVPPGMSTQSVELERSLVDGKLVILEFNTASETTNMEASIENNVVVHLVETGCEA